MGKPTSFQKHLKIAAFWIEGNPHRSANSLREYGELFDKQARDELVRTIEEEAGRLARFVANLLDMTRLEAGAIELKREPSDISEVIGAAYTV